MTVNWYPQSTLSQYSLNTWKSGLIFADKPINIYIYQLDNTQPTLNKLLIKCGSDIDWISKCRLSIEMWIELRRPDSFNQSTFIVLIHSSVKKKVTKFNAIDWSIIKSLVVSFRSPRHSLFSLIPYYFHLPSSRNPSWSQPKPITHWETLGRRLGVCNHNYCLLIKYKQTQLILSVNYFWVIFL